MVIIDLILWKRVANIAISAKQAFPDAFSFPKKNTELWSSNSLKLAYL